MRTFTNKAEAISYMRQLTKQNMDFLQNLLRSNYMGDRIERGSLAEVHVLLR
jgi:hypothetical protein